jgi:hypothetical protein
MFAADMRAGETQLDPEKIGQKKTGLDLAPAFDPVDGQSDGDGISHERVPQRAAMPA